MCDVCGDLYLGVTCSIEHWCYPGIEDIDLQSQEKDRFPSFAAEFRQAWQYKCMCALTCDF